MAGGRKSHKDEIQVVKYMTELAPRTFALIKGYLEAEATEESSDEQRRMIKADRKWAMEQMMKLYGKAVPQAGDDAENPIYTAQITGMKIQNDNDASTETNKIQDESTIPSTI